MSRFHPLVVVALLAAALPLRAADGTAAETVVGSLYKGHFSRSQRWDLTLKRERARFTASLLRMLDEDMAAQAATPNEVVGLDYDPLTNSQEAMDSYKVGAARLEEGKALVPVELHIGQFRSTLTIHLASVDGRWRVSNIQDEEGDLVTTLKALKAERERARAKPRLESPARSSHWLGRPGLRGPAAGALRTAER